LRLIHVSRSPFQSVFMRLRFIWIGKTRDARLRALIEDYLTRLGHFVRYEVTELRESVSRDDRAGIEDEGKRIIGALNSYAVSIVLDINGRVLSSEELAAEIETWQNSGTKQIEFVIGGVNGVSTETLKRAKHKWSLSSFTLTHEMARVVLVEQLYRAYTIVHGLPYQK
jgi:23S rRNA (pseudouridine1915-N3)-methyltransferase